MLQITFSHSYLSISLWSGLLLQPADRLVRSSVSSLSETLADRVAPSSVSSGTRLSQKTTSFPSLCGSNGGASKRKHCSHFRVSGLNVLPHLGYSTARHTPRMRICIWSAHVADGVCHASWASQGRAEPAIGSISYLM